MDPSNLISHCGRTAYIRSSRAGHTEGRKVKDGQKESERERGAEGNDAGDGLR